MIADDLVTLWRVCSGGSFFRTAAKTTLRRHHISLIEHLLFLFSEQKDLFALHTWNFYIGHNLTSHVGQNFGYAQSLPQHLSAA
jgi:hypothetical protein